MSAGHADGVTISLHQQPPGLGPLQNRKLPAAGLLDFRVGIRHSGRADDQRGGAQAIGAVADMH